jgi:arginine-tRNA-protein transferase
MASAPAPQVAPTRLVGPYFHPNGKCPYLEDRQWSSFYLLDLQRADMESIDLDDAAFSRLLSVGFRRTGRAFYTPSCKDCRECVSIRVPVRTFEPTPDQKRAWRKNPDVRLEVNVPTYSAEKLSMYKRFLEARYPTTTGQPTTEASYHSFFVQGFGNTREFDYYLGDRLVGVGIVDLVPDAASSVYFYFDPDLGSRSLGTYSALREIEYCKETGRDYLYLGFRVAGCKAMAYKSNYRPHELLHTERGWLPEAEWQRLQPS